MRMYRRRRKIYPHDETSSAFEYDSLNIKLFGEFQTILNLFSDDISSSMHQDAFVEVGLEKMNFVARRKPIARQNGIIFGN